MAHDIRDLIQALDLTSVHILGYSMGSMIALELCRILKDLPASLILYAPSLDGEDSKRRIDTFVDMNLPELIRIEALFSEEWLASQSDLPGIFPKPVHPINRDVILRQSRALAEWSIPAGFRTP